MHVLDERICLLCSALGAYYPNLNWSACVGLSFRKLHCAYLAIISALMFADSVVDASVILPELDGVKKPTLCTTVLLERITHFYPLMPTLGLYLHLDIL